MQGYVYGLLKPRLVDAKNGSCISPGYQILRQKTAQTTLQKVSTMKTNIMNSARLRTIALESQIGKNRTKLPFALWGLFKLIRLRELPSLRPWGLKINFGPPN